MKCAWQDLLNTIPPGLRPEVDTLGRSDLWELRLRIGRQPELVGPWGSKWLKNITQRADISYVINAASRYSPWASETANQGYLTTSGGHRIGLCGRAVIQNASVRSMKEISSLCIRVARDYPGAAKGLPEQGSILIIGKPGAGKTTLLRDLIRQRSNQGSCGISVVDERGEIFPEGIFEPGIRTDILLGCSKAQGIEVLLRTMGPGVIAVDEITADKDCDALLHSGWCGVALLATAHAGSKEEMCQRPVYQKLLANKLFDWLVILQQDKSWKLERM